MDDINKNIKRRTITIRSLASTLYVYAIPLCLFPIIAIAYELTSTPFIIFLSLYTSTALLAIASIAYIKRMNVFEKKHIRVVSLIQLGYWAVIFPVWLILLEGARSSGLIFSLIILIYTLAFSGLKLAIILNAYVAVTYLSTSYLSITYYKQTGSFEQELLILTAYLPVSIIIAQLGTLLATRKRRANQLLSQLEKAHLKLQETSQKLEDASTTDRLTGLVSYREITNRLHYELKKVHRNRSSMSILILQLDQFTLKNIHDEHHITEQALKFVAENLNRYFRTTDSVSRWSANDFLVLMPDTSIQEAHSVAARVIQSITETPLNYNSNLLTITVSGGLYELTHDTNLDIALQAANERLYMAKDLGHNKIISNDQQPLQKFH